MSQIGFWKVMKSIQKPLVFVPFGRHEVTQIGFWEVMKNIEKRIVLLHFEI